MTFTMKMRDIQDEAIFYERKEIAYRMFNKNMDINCIAQIVDEPPATVQSWIDSQKQENN